jgi:hypothetical protein
MRYCLNEKPMQYKDKSIKDITAYLQSKYGDNIIIKDHWDADNFAIGLTNKKGDSLVYISTWKKKVGEHFISLESPTEKIDAEYKESGDFDNIGIDKVDEVVSLHLNLK